MRLVSKILATFMLCALATVPSVVRAEDDNFTDGKNYPGSMCDSVFSSTISAKPGGMYMNQNGASAAVTCPIIQDSWKSNNPLQFSKMLISNSAGQTFSCTQTTYDSNGNTVGSRSFSTTAGGITLQSFWNGVSYGPSAQDGYISILCGVPHVSTIRYYQVQEQA